MTSMFMKAAVAHEYGPPDSLRLEDWPVTTPGVGEVRIGVHSVGLTFVDALVAAGKHQHKPALPFIPGTEFSGQVLEVGEGVDHLAVGDRVCGGRMGGILSEQVTLPAGRVQKLPAGVDMDQAAILRASYLTSWYALDHCGHLAAGETVVVLGAAGAVGIAACQIARHLGATVIASASSEAKRRFALDNGAHHAIDTHAPDWRDQIKALTSGNGIDVVFDPVGGEATERAFRSLAYKGRHLVVGFASGSIPSLPVNLALLKGASLVGVLAQYFDDREPEENAATRARILELFAAGVLRPPVGQVFSLDDFAAAMKAAEGGEILGRVVVRVV